MPIEMCGGGGEERRENWKATTNEHKEEHQDY